MENTAGLPSPDDASAALADAEASRIQLAGSLALPSHFFASIGVAITAQIATAAVGVTRQDAWAASLAFAGVGVFILVAVIQLARFRRLNGVWLGGLAGRSVLGTATSSWLSYALALGGAVWAGFDEVWWLVAVCSVAGGVAYALSGRHWMRVYRQDPAGHGRGESVWQLAALGAIAVAGLVVLVIAH